MIKVFGRKKNKIDKRFYIKCKPRRICNGVREKISKKKKKKFSKRISPLPGIRYDSAVNPVRYHRCRWSERGYSIRSNF